MVVLEPNTKRRLSRPSRVGRPRTHSPRRRGIFWAESLTALGILFTVGVLLGQATLGYVRARNDHLLERALRGAAAAQLQRYLAGVALDTPPPEGLILDAIIIDTHHEPGTGPWQDLIKVTVTASSEGRAGRARKSTLTGYIARSQP